MVESSAIEYANSLSDSDLRLILSSWKTLSPDDIEVYVASGVGRTLVRLEYEGFRCSEGDPLLALCIDPTNLNVSTSYLHGGNYLLPQGVPGQHPMPGGEQPPYGASMAHLPMGWDAAPPFALGRFIRERFPEVIDMTMGASMNVFYLPDLNVFSRISVAVMGSRQFVRIGHGMVHFGRHHEPPLARVFVLDRVNSPPQDQPQFAVDG